MFDGKGVDMYERKSFKSLSCRQESTRQLSADLPLEPIGSLSEPIEKRKNPSVRRCTRARSEKEESLSISRRRRRLHLNVVSRTEMVIFPRQMD